MAAGAAVLGLLAAAACGTASPPLPVLPPSAVVHVLRCAWYSPTVVGGTPDGQQVVIAITGPGCSGQALIGWIAGQTGKPWATTTLVTGTPIAQLASGLTTVQVWQDGYAPQTEATAGGLADDFERAGWTVQDPPTTGPIPPTPSLGNPLRGG